MHPRIITPNRVWVVIVTTVVVSILNLLIEEKENYPANEKYYLERVLRGPILEDDPLLVKWVRDKFVQPSTLPYNLDNRMNGLASAESENEVFSPSQEFILSKVEEILGDQIKRGGRFLEAGAYNGEFLSNTLFLEATHGWKGILVEPHPRFFDQLLSKNRKAWCINACLSDHPWPSQEVFISVFGDPSTNHLVNGIKADSDLEKNVNLGSSGLAKYGDSQNKVEDKFLVQCYPLITILEAVGMTSIDFFSLDVERAEMGILNSIPWDKISFKILAIEHKSLDDLKKLMEEKGYSHVESFLQDHIFVNKKISFGKNKKPRPKKPQFP